MLDWTSPRARDETNARLQRDPAGVPYSAGYLIFKRCFDLISALVLLPLMLTVAAGLLLLNPLLNRGKIFFLQERMGRYGQPFLAWKFRTMTQDAAIQRGPFDALEHHRITRLGRILRRSRLDELPQILNVLRGEMSLIGPRPDFLPHARSYLDLIDGYAERLSVRPGISGYAQIVHGYVDGLDGIRAKVAADLHYIRHATIRLDLWIAWQTFLTVIGNKGR